jgi:hypothetical protein
LQPDLLPGPVGQIVDPPEYTLRNSRYSGRAASTSVLHGTALNIGTPSDLAGTYTGIGGGAAVAAGVSGVRLRNENGVVLELRGAKLGVEVSANLTLITITMK